MLNFGRSVQILGRLCRGHVTRYRRLGQKRSRANRLHTLYDAVHCGSRGELFRVGGVNSSALTAIELGCRSREQQPRGVKVRRDVTSSHCSPENRWFSNQSRSGRSWPPARNRARPPSFHSTGLRRAFGRRRHRPWRRKEHCSLVYGAIRQFDPSEPHGLTPD